MSESVNLSLSFDGNFPGIAEKRLSLRTFNQSLGFLLKAIQETADEVISGKPRGQKGGRLRKDSLDFDLQIQIEEGSLKLFGPLILPAMLALQPRLDEKPLAEQVAQLLLEKMESEYDTSKPTSKSIQKFFRYLPSTITTQRYEATDASGRTLKSVNLSAPPVVAGHYAEIPRTIRFDGLIDRVGFRKPRVDIFDLKSRAIHFCAATTELVDIAVKNKNRRVSGMILSNPQLHSTKLLYLHAKKDAPPPKTRDEVMDNLYRNWDEALRLLAQ